MSFYLIREQGEGCNYTIKCGLDCKKLVGPDKVEPSTMEEAEKLAVTDDIYLGPWEVGEPGECYFESGFLTPSCPCEMEIHSARILEVVAEKVIDIPAYVAESKARLDAGAAVQKEKADRAELARLQALYGK